MNPSRTLITDAPIAVIDFEMTGLHPTDDQPVEVAVVHLDPSKPPRLVMQTRIRPTVPMTAGASRVTGITDADLVDAPSWTNVSPQVLAALDGRIPCAYNAPTDLRWLTAAQNRIGGPVPAWPWLDPLVIVKEVDRYERAKTLAAACERAGIAVDAHGAAGDAVATALLWPLLLRHLQSAPCTIDDYLTRQTALALAQEQDFTAYLRRQGARGARPECPWHELEGQSLPFWPAPAPPSTTCPSCSTRVVYRVARDGRVVLTDLEPVAPDLAHDCDSSIPY